MNQINSGPGPGRWLLGLGALLILLGLLALAASFSATMATVFLIGILLLVAGFAQLAQAILGHPPGSFWRILAGCLYTLVGFLLVIDPVRGAIGLTLLFAMLFLFGGALRLALAAAARKLGFPAGWPLAGGILNFLLAILIIAGWPGTGTWVIGLFVGIELLFSGISLVVVTMAVRRSF